MERFLGGSLVEFVGLTLVLFGGAAWMMGQALGANWRPVWHVFAYALLLGAANRFFHNALFAGNMFSLPAYLIDTAILMAIGWVAYRVTRAHRMVTQYPWLYSRDGPFNWRAKG